MIAYTDCSDRNFFSCKDFVNSVFCVRPGVHVESLVEVIVLNNSSKYTIRPTSINSKIVVINAKVRRHSCRDESPFIRSSINRPGTEEIGIITKSNHNIIKPFPLKFSFLHPFNTVPQTPQPAHIVLKPISRWFEVANCGQSLSVRSRLIAHWNLPIPNSVIRLG